MALMTRAKFYYGVEIEADNNLFEFDDGAGETTIEIPAGFYSPVEIAEKLALLMSQNGGQTYVGSFDRVTRLINITSVANFSILIATGSHSTAGAYQSLGFTGGLDLSGANSYDGIDYLGKEFVPQFYLLDYTPLENNVKSIQATLSETASGHIEVVRYGKKRFMECSIEYITNMIINSDPNSIWQDNRSGYEDALDFMNVITEKSRIEFMPDINDVETFSNLVLESTEDDSNGTGFKLKEMNEVASGVYKTGKLTFREVT
jgi:hypothetical protein